MPRLLAYVLGRLGDGAHKQPVAGRPRNFKMDAFMAHIHHNEQLSIDNVSKALAESKEKKTARN